MTIVRKMINGKPFYYFEDWDKINGKAVMTYIGSITADQDNSKFTKNFVKHLNELYKRRLFINDGNFEEYLATPVTIGVLKIAKALYQMVRSNLPKSNISEIERDLLERYVHSTTAIEGYTLNLTETKNLLSEAELTPDGKPYPDSTAVINYKAVETYISNYHGDINEKLILQLHKLIMNNLNEGPIGEYKQTDKRGIPGVNHPRWQDIPKHIDDLIQWYYNNNNNFHQIELASIFHQRFEQIHPFWDGNGRTGRAILDFMLRQHGFPTIFIEVIKQRDEYIAALRAGNTTPKREGNYTPIIEFIVQRVRETLIHIFVKTVGIVDVIQSDEFKEFVLEQVGKEIYEEMVNLVSRERESINSNIRV